MTFTFLAVSHRCTNMSVVTLLEPSRWHIIEKPQTQDGNMRPESRPDSPMESAVPKSSVKGVFIAFLYGLCSLSMALMNKAVLNTYSFNYPMLLVLCQMVFTVTLLEFLRLTNQITLPKFTLARSRSFLVPSIFYGIHSVLSLTALSGMNIPMYGVIKRCSPAVILLLGTFVLRKGLPSVQTCLSVGLITFGCLMAGQFTQNIPCIPEVVS